MNNRTHYTHEYEMREMEKCWRFMTRFDLEKNNTYWYIRILYSPLLSYTVITNNKKDGTMKITTDWHIHSRNSCDSACMVVSDLVVEAANLGIRECSWRCSGTRLRSQWSHPGPWPWYCAIPSLWPSICLFCCSQEGAMPTQRTCWT